MLSRYIERTEVNSEMLEAYTPMAINKPARMGWGRRMMLEDDVVFVLDSELSDYTPCNSVELRSVKHFIKQYVAYYSPEDIECKHVLFGKVEVIALSLNEIEMVLVVRKGVSRSLKDMAGIAFKENAGIDIVNATQLASHTPYNDVMNLSKEEVLLSIASEPTVCGVSYMPL